jgi:thiamine kinase-like enzyme
MTTPPIPNDLEYVAKGSYGCVVRPALPNRRNDTWVHYPNQVTKLYFHKSNLRKSIKNSKYIHNLLGNSGHRSYTYKHKYYASNIPNNIRRRCKKISSRSTLYPLRLPDLGNDFYDIPKTYTSYRSIYVGTILDQIFKVMKQIQTLSYKKQIHGDIRETNLMISKKGILTLIDFDYLYPYAEFFEEANFGFYCHPPETFIYEKFKFLLQAEPAELEYFFSSIQKRMEKYVKHHSTFIYLKPLHQVLTLEGLQSAIRDTITYYSTRLDPSDTSAQLQAALRDDLLPVFDGYGFAFTILNFIAYVYPSVLEPVQKPEFDSVLARRLTNHGDAYTPAEITAIRETLHRLAFDVLLPMSDLRIQYRIPIDSAVEHAHTIISSFHGKK